MFENVNYTFYSDTMGRSVIPDESAFNLYALKNRLFVQRLSDDGLIIEREDNGIDKAVCMMVEVDYVAGGDERETVSESVGGYSWSGKDKSLEAKKYEWLKAFCYITNGRN